MWRIFCSGAIWAEASVAACNYSDLTREICDLINVCEHSLKTLIVNTFIYAPVTKKVERPKNFTSDSNRLGSTEAIVSITVLVTAAKDMSGNLSVRHFCSD